MNLTLSANILTPEVKRVPGMLASTGRLEDDIPFLSENGYKGLEFITVNPKELDVGKLEKMMSRYQMRPVGVNTGRICGELGLTLTDPNPEIRECCEKKTRECLDFAALWGIPVNVGILRGTISKGGDKATVENRLVESLKRLSDYALGKKVRLMIETVAPPMMDFLNTLDQAKEIIDSVGNPEALGLMFDFMQMAITEDDMVSSIRKHIGCCSHLHFSDTDRKVPGDGAIDFEGILRTLSDLDYSGSASIEIAPVPSEAEAAIRAAEYLLPLFEKYK